MKRSDDLESTSKCFNDPVAIIGIGCRFPGGSNDPHSFWELMAEGRDGIVEVPKDRWNSERFWDPDPEKPGKMYMKAGGFIQQKIDQFDALFFGMSPREAEYLDPQQRVLLEVTWEAFEDAGLAMEQLAGSDTGVYVGGFMFDNMLTQLSPLNRALIGTHTAVSSTLSILANRLSYVFDLRGPNIAMDTACSSSLVAIHQACQALHCNECSLAVAGGVNIMYRPENPISMCKGGFLSKDGRCKSFDARADGYGRGEGAGIVVLKPLSAALRDGNDIYAVIRGTGVNQDGRTNGITVPNPEAQEQLVRRVCREAEVDPRHIRYFEAHGTGTAVGDPLEARALGAVVGRERDSGERCIVGSVKANIGHLEAASGVAGVIKGALCLKHQQIPPIANLETPNPAIPFDELGLRLPTGLEPMPAGTGPALVGINSFGYGGTNAHAILEESPLIVQTAASGHDDRGPWLLPVSARSPKALQALAGAYQNLITQKEGLKLRDLCHSAGVHRSHHDLRCAIVADSKEVLLERLAAVAAGEPAQGVAQGNCAAKGQKPVFVFTGMGPQWWAMGQELYQSEPVFRQMALAIDEIFQQLAGWSILKEMLAEEAVSRITETHIAQPANFVIQAGLAAMWQARGIEPAAVVGHSVGEVTAAYVAGVLTLEDAVKVSFHRSRIQHKAAGLGTMLAVGAGMTEAAALLTGFADRASVAAANGPSSTTLAGDRDVLEMIAAGLERKGEFNRFLRVEMAYHSPYMDRLRPELLDSMADLQPNAPKLPLYSTVTGQQVTGITYDAEYWCRNVREPVYFAKAIDRLLADGHRLFLELGPHPVLSASVKECARSAGITALTAASLRRGEPEKAQFLAALGELYTAGVAVDWRRQSDAGSRFVKLPTYPWQRETYWHESMASLNDRLGRGTHPLLGFRMDGPDQAWSQTLNPNYLPYLEDHQVDGLIVLPGAAYVELGFAVRTEADFGTDGAIEDLRFAKAMVIGAHEEPELRTVYYPDNREYRVYGRSDNAQPWALHAAGRLSRMPLAAQPRLDIKAVREQCSRHTDGSRHYHNMGARGLHYGPWFQGVRELWRDADCREVLARIERKEEANENDPRDVLDPTLLDACFQTLLALLDSSDRRIYVPVAIRRVALWQKPGSHIWCHGRLTAASDDTVEGDIKLCDEDGKVLVEVLGVRAQALNQAENGVEANLDHWFYDYGWTRSETPRLESLPAGRWLLLLDRQGIGERLARAPHAKSAELIRAYPGDRFSAIGDGNFRVTADDRKEIGRLLQAVDPASLSGIICFWGLDADAAHDPVGIDMVTRGLNLIQALADSERHNPGFLSIITRGAQAVLPDETKTALAQTSLIGLLRVAINEYPEQAFRAIDLDPGADPLPMLLQELGAADGEEEIAYREGVRYVRRLNRKLSDELAAPAPERLLRIGASQPGADQITIAVHGCALGREEARRLVGSSEAVEIAVTGIVKAIGSGVQGLAAGEPVFAVYQGEPAQTVVLPAVSAIPLHPESKDKLNTLAGQLLPFMTAHYALNHLARVSSGERVLIHEADTSLGLAAIQVALRQGAEVFATVGDLTRIDLVRQQGAVHVTCGRSADFTEQVMEQAGGQQIDVAFGAFDGEYAGKAAAILAPLGRMIALQNDTGENVSAPANRTIFRVCVKSLRSERPDLFQKLIQEVDDLLRDGAYTPIEILFISPATVGKIDPYPGYTAIGEQVMFPVDDHLKAEAVIGQPNTSQLPLRSDCTYLITGGFGGFGMELARWLAKQGVRHLVLVGRRGVASDEAKELVKQLEREGVNVCAAAADVSRDAEVAALLTQIAACMPPLRGIFHTAAVLDDSPINASDPERFAAVMRPKALGAWHLHQHTAHLPLELFVSFSSISALIGNPAQGAYVAANVVLDTLAHLRRARGLAATSINWGALSDIGMVAQDAGVEEYFKRVGIGFFNPAQALDVLRHVLEWNPAQLGAAVIDCHQWAQFNPAWAASPRYKHLIAESNRLAEGGIANEFRAALFTLPAEARQDYTAATLIELISDIMRIPADKIDRRQSLVNLGVDSLMAMELQTAIVRKTGAKLSTLELMKGNPIEQLASQTLGLLKPAAQETAATPAAHERLAEPVSPKTITDDPEMILAHLDDLSEDEIDEMLATLMKI